MKELLLIVLAYLIGSIPTALIVSKKFFGIDIRDYGSGNMGATNTFRVLGSKYGTLVMVIDILKGLVAASLYGFIPFYLHNELERTNFMIGLGLAAMLGHIFPLFAGFKGGKGVATLFGMILAVQPVIAVSCTGVFLLVLYLTRYVSLSSILAAVALPICVLWIWNEHEILYRAFALVVAGMVVFTHQKNIGRILRGVESRIPILKHRDRRKARRRHDQ
ncbi:MAG TPA: glycerol-3-phosphate 1-O-acyltransferase PlsY [Ferruginibacter sp.]|jgi:glycerol-3-phosphate acyltransferase PlsY|nr:glycerol-3-phosphate 1-O-acyltransferase PlsY [Ferruginibacter sp.]MBN8700968.1 glycerol-3-phosphate 1-O-acyltransferase PlsY [Chitinophagales bacterium]HMW25576.1 glycerol-3-phosphate 1-O-acyltransferase PlsY [Ferruginibacter sp.]HMX38483.1 glycerol-3-phosphate 1-O-acyltransferase PlsY [Ferruginibacter sp.]HNA01050.1 glycerol-3-phosphate 1-O-acyltransferase PlsY [Ferruginibacter sp.]